MSSIFNKNIKHAIDLHPENAMYRAINKYLTSHSTNNYYTALDDIGYLLNFCYRLEVTPAGKFIPAFLYLPNNPFNEPHSIRLLLDKDSGFKNRNKALDYLSRKYISEIGRIRDPKFISLVSA